MTITDLIVIGIVVLIVGAASWYIIKSKKSGVKCIGCPSGSKCSGNCSGGCGENCSCDRHSEK